MERNISVIEYKCYQNATEKQLDGIKWKKERVYRITDVYNEKIRKELYEFIDARCRRLALATVVGDIYRFDVLKAFLNKKGLSLNSITDLEWRTLESKFKAYLYQNGLSMTVRRKRIDRKSVERQNSANVSYLHMFYESVVQSHVKDIPEQEKDIWDMRNLENVPRQNKIRGRYRLDFSEITQMEFRKMIKRILYSHCSYKAMGTIKGELLAFRRFTKFLRKTYPKVVSFHKINRKIIEAYLIYIKTETGLSAISYTTELSVLGKLLDEIGRELEEYTLCNLFFAGDFKSYNNALPKAYSDEEITRFNQALIYLEPQLARCILIHELLGTRIEDTLTLKRDCLFEKNGHYFIFIEQPKSKAYTKPISIQLVKLIKKAIAESEEKYEDSEYIFVRENGKLYTDELIKYHVNIMIYENDIRDDSGEYFEFRTHRFRHTYGVKLTEMKLDDESIARLLGHRDTRSIPHYRQLRSKMLAQETKTVRNEMDELLRQYRKERQDGKI